jgi:cytochrome c biogenesis protein CcmG/thiol:disulfide interchange protein DsbE
MSRGLRLIPIILLLWLVAGFAWRLVKPGDPAVPSQMVERSLPDFRLTPAVSGKAGLNSTDLATGKPRLLNVFASWCVPCIGEAPVLSELERRGVEIDGIAVRDSPAEVTRFLADHGDPYSRIGSDPHSEAQIALGSSGVPETFIVDGHGVIRRQYIGPLTKANIPALVAELGQLR